MTISRYDLDIADRALRPTIDSEVVPRVARDAHRASSNV